LYEKIDITDYYSRAKPDTAERVMSAGISVTQSQVDDKEAVKADAKTSAPAPVLANEAKADRQAVAAEQKEVKPIATHKRAAAKDVAKRQAKIDAKLLSRPRRAAAKTQEYDESKPSQGLGDKGNVVVGVAFAAVGSTTVSVKLPPISDHPSGGAGGGDEFMTENNFSASDGFFYEKFRKELLQEMRGVPQGGIQLRMRTAIGPTASASAS
jgi:hypothetical protein